MMKCPFREWESASPSFPSSSPLSSDTRSAGRPVGLFFDQERLAGQFAVAFVPFEILVANQSAHILDGNTDRSGDRFNAGVGVQPAGADDGCQVKHGFGNLSWPLRCEQYRHAMLPAAPDDPLERCRGFSKRRADEVGQFVAHERDRRT
ncbi:unannotated protein [freshwater metagenome]|uniref:Unannotated protein n=1 Tax=freshwater metagenome TaxID=449393 RepID=A0A6J7BYZ4_9ZZZZ